MREKNDILFERQAVGIELRGLLASVDSLFPSLPLWSHREIEMTHKVLSKDMAGLVQAMKLAQQYSRTTVESMSSLSIVF